MNAHDPSLNRYCEGFTQASEPWPPLPLDPAPELSWWREQLAAGADGSLRGSALLAALRRGMPQLLLPQVDGISTSDLYKALVLRGEDPHTAAHLEARQRFGAEPQWHDLDALRLEIAEHPCGAMPVLHTANRHDFEQLVRALAHRAEPAALSDGVHAQAISGLIHWELIQRFGRQSRAQLIVLHQAPYGSVAVEQVPGHLDDEAWLKASTVLRLEHELTHLATKRLLGQMRINLLDELVADAMGMVAALGCFDAGLFGRCLGLDGDDTPIVDGRWLSYTRELDPHDSHQAIKLVMERARELETCLQRQPELLASDQAMRRLQWLCQQRLDVPICVAA